MRRLLLAALLAAPACSSPSGPGDPGSAQWLSVVLTREDPTVRVEKVEYLSEGLRIFGQVCRPPGGGRFPVLVLNHGGFEGLGPDWNGGLCVAFARAGYVTVESSYRGEDGSQGRIEFCLGEVGDVLSMLGIALAQPYADAQRVSMLGLSHGACITVRAIERGAAVRAAVDVFGPTEAAALFRFWQARVAAGDPRSAEYRELIARGRARRRRPQPRRPGRRRRARRGDQLPGRERPLSPQAARISAVSPNSWAR